MNIKLSFCFFLIFWSTFHAQNHYREPLIINKDTFIFDNIYPLETYTKINNLRQKMVKKYNSCKVLECPNLYFAIWQLINNELYLVKLTSCCYKFDSIEINLKDLFPKLFIKNKVKANWVNGSLFASGGKLLFNDNFMNEPVFTKDIQLNFKNGKLIKRIDYDNSKSKKSKYTDDSELVLFLHNKIKYDSIVKGQIESTLVAEISANKNGIIDSVKIIKNFNRAFDEKAKKVFKSIPNWDIIYKRGKHRRDIWTIPIHVTFEE